MIQFFDFIHHVYSNLDGREIIIGQDKELVGSRVFGRVYFGRDKEFIMYEELNPNTSLDEPAPEVEKTKNDDVISVDMKLPIAVRK